ncbi:unnamed protein product [Sympodiomycopsis kandeliae]
MHKLRRNRNSKIPEAMSSLPAGFTLRPSRVGSDEDAQAIYDLITAVSWPYTLQTIRQWNRFEGIFLIVEDASQKVVATSSVFQQGCTASVGATITLPEYRGKGFAFTLVGTCIEHCKKNFKDVESLILAASALGAPVYRRLGFKEFSDAGRLVCKLGAAGSRNQEAAHSNVDARIAKRGSASSSVTRQQWEELITLAGAAMNRDRRQVMEMHFLSNGRDDGSELEVVDDLLLVTHGDDSNKLTGALCARPQTDSLWSIGPVLAQDVQEAKILLDAGISILCQNVAETTEVAMAADIENPVTRGLCAYAQSQYGFEQKLTNLLMERVLSTQENVVGPARNLSQDIANGQKDGPHQYTLLDLGYL